MQWILLWLSATFVGVWAGQSPNIIFILADDLVSCMMQCTICIVFTHVCQLQLIDLYIHPIPVTCCLAKSPLSHQNNVVCSCIPSYS